MICKFCNTENPDEARFCSACGHRIDGKILCPKCGKENAEGAVFCIFCGDRLDGKRVCPDCGKVLPEGANFCPACGHAPQLENAVPPEREMPAEPTKNVQKKPLSFWLQLFGGISLIAATAFSLIFVFCLGLTANISATNPSSALALGLDTDISIYDLFSEVYENIELSMTSYPAHGGYLEYSLYFRAALGTLTAVTALIAVPICTLVACIRYARAVRGKPGNSDYFTPAAAAYGVFLCCACTLLALYSFSFRAEYEGMGGGLSLSLNDATLAGLILGGLFFGTGTALLFAAKGKAICNRKSITRAVFAPVGTIAAIIILAFAASGTIGFQANNTSGSGNILYFMSAAGISCITKIQTTAAGEAVATPDACVALSLFGQIFQLAVIAFAVVIFISAWKNIEKERNSNLVLAILLAVFALFMLIMNVVFGDCWLDYQYGDTTYPYGNTATVELSYSASIVVLIFAVLLLAGAITVLALTRTKQQALPTYEGQDMTGQAYPADEEQNMAGQTYPMIEGQDAAEQADRETP